MFSKCIFELLNLQAKNHFFCLREHVALLIFNAQKMLVFFFNLDIIYNDIFLQKGFLREPI